MVDMANLKGGDDNITVVLVYVANDARLLEPPTPADPQETVQTEEIEFDPYAPTWVPEMASDPED